MGIMNRKLDESKNIINYLKFQRIPFNKNLPKVLEKYIFDKDGFRNLKKPEKDLITPVIKEEIEIFEDSCQNYNINYLNYILILESLPNDKTKNLYRYFSLRWNYLLNTDEGFTEYDRKNLRLKHIYNVIYSSGNPKKLLLETLKELKSKKDITIIYFIGCLNQFIT
jgi:hypothetical protein